MTGYSPASFHDLFFYDDLLSEGSSVGDLSPLGYPALWEYGCAGVAVGPGGNQGYAHHAKLTCAGPG
jgi:hypothetical protein